MPTAAEHRTAANKAMHELIIVLWGMVPPTKTANQRLSAGHRVIELLHEMAEELELAAVESMLLRLRLRAEQLPQGAVRSTLLELLKEGP